MTKIGISYWGFCEKLENCNTANTPDGHRYGRPILVDDLNRRGHTVYALQKKRELSPYPGLLYAHDWFPDLDILFVEWRWSTYKNSGPDKFEPDLDRQIELLDYYYDKIPIVVWDTDLKMTPEDEARWPNMIVADPTLDPQSFSIPRIRLTFWSDFKVLFKPYENAVEFGYVGNNYEREEMFRKYYSNPASDIRSNGIQTKVWGNWLQRSPERPSPEQIIREYPQVAFSDRVSFRESMAILNKFICTVHITKPRYAKQGFCSPRYLENIITNTPALVPGEFYKNTILGSQWVVESANDVVRKLLVLQRLSSEERGAIVNEQRENLLKIHDFRVSYVSDLLEDIAQNSDSAIRNVR